MLLLSLPVASVPVSTSDWCVALRCWRPSGRSIYLNFRSEFRLRKPVLSVITTVSQSATLLLDSINCHEVFNSFPIGSLTELVLLITTELLNRTIVISCDLWIKQRERGWPLLRQLFDSSLVLSVCCYYLVIMDVFQFFPRVETAVSLPGCVPCRCDKMVPTKENRKIHVSAADKSIGYFVVKSTVFSG